MRLWMENSFLWLATQFGHEKLGSKPYVLPTPEHSRFADDGSKEYLTMTAKVVARQMEIDINEVNLDTYEQNIQDIWR